MDHGLMDRDQEWERFKEGDEEVFNALYEKYANILYAYGIKIVSNDNTVKECIQELFIGLYDRRMHIEQPRNWVSYLLVSLRHKLYKRRKRMRFLELDAKEVSRKLHFELSINKLETQENSDIREEQLQALQCALDELTPQQREIIYLKYYKDLSVEEVASIIGINSQMVYNATYKAMLRLRKNSALARFFNTL